MVDTVPIGKILFLDIETVPAVRDWNELDEDWQKLWEKKIEYKLGEEDTPQSFYEKRAGILAEFGKIICISCGFVHKEKLRITSFYGDDEKKILEEFIQMLSGISSQSDRYLCAHNGKEFDFPYLGRRMLINGLKLPALLNIQGKKPWEIKHLDTMELWKFGDFKNYTSLNLLAKVFGIPTPKDDIDGSQVAEVYYKDHDLERIRVYCEKDVLTVAQILRRFRGESLLERES